LKRRRSRTSLRIRRPSRGMLVVLNGKSDSAVIGIIEANGQARSHGR
jgi:hypothetical protein